MYLKDAQLQTSAIGLTKYWYPHDASSRKLRLGTATAGDAYHNDGEGEMAASHKRHMSIGWPAHPTGLLSTDNQGP